MSTVNAEDIARRAIRDCLSCFATGVAVITATGLEGLPAGLTVNSFASVSLDPPLILWSLRRDSRIFSAFQASPGFIVNILASHQGDLSAHFAGKAQEKWAHIRYDRGLYGIPRLAGAHATLECEKHAKHEGGDHVIFVGRAVSFMTDPEAKPLVFYRGRYRNVVT
jgi:flavin reductase (DIM6/NTAB) family NADH-FMN oxidoreductase RutF